jgi:NADP-dependent 3-hydroxy acid dehydrogenase YdfG
MGQLADRRVLITGASRGIGAAVARAVAAEGGRLALLARPSTQLTALASELDALPLPVDIRDVVATTTAIRDAGNVLGGLDALVNNAGIYPMGTVRDGDPADWQAMLEVNVLGLLAATRAAIPYLTAERSPQIINIGSTAGNHVAYGIQGVYGGTKHAVRAVTDGLRKELFEGGIRVTIVTPGLVRTDGSSAIKDDGVRAAMAQVQDKIGLEPAELARQIVHVLALPKDVHMVELALTSAREEPA